MEALFESLQIMEHIMAMTFGLPRIFVAITILPFMASQILTGQLKFCIAIALYFVLHPLMLDEAKALSWTEYHFLFIVLVIIKEALLGFFIGLLVGILFWAIQSAGFFIDNQRGLTQAMESDPLSGEQTSPLGSFFFQGIVYIFFSGGAFLVFLQFLYASYILYPVREFIPLSVFTNENFPIIFAGQVGYLMQIMLLFSAPIIVACLLTDISLALINRFASQLNVYILAMPIKSGIVAFLLIFYFALLVKGFNPILNNIFQQIEKQLTIIL